MGTKLVTFYRILLVVVSTSALVLTILSTTSCQFLDYDHQFQSETLLGKTNDGNRMRVLQDDIPGNDGAAGGTMGDGSAGGVASGAVDYPGDGGASGDGVVAPGGNADGDTAGGGDETPTGNDAYDAGVSVGGDVSQMGGPSSVPEDSIPIPAPSPTAMAAGSVIPTFGKFTASPVGGSGSGGSQQPEMENDPLQNVADMINAFGGTVANATGGNGMDGEYNATNFESDIADMIDSMAGGIVGAMNASSVAGTTATLGGEGGEEEDATTTTTTTTTTTSSGSSSSNMDAASNTEILVQGSAGLFCNEEQTLSQILFGSSPSSEESTFTEAEKQKLSNLEDEIASESANEEAEELARNGALVAIVFGILIWIILFLECLFGGTMWCEKWIVGLLGVGACVSQGITFLMFDSDRYCDGNIIHEITNGEPCTIGQGAAMSISALLLYFLIILMACRVPEGDAYGLRRLCCKKKNDGRGNAGALNMNDEDAGGLMSGNARGKGDENTAVSGRERDSPHWLSKDENENEVI